jgi:hypothetical protein
VTRRVPLDRLRDVSKQRRIRRPLLAVAGDGWAEPQDEAEPEKAEWPVSL